MVQVIGRRIVGNEDVGSAVGVEIGCDDSQPSPFAIDKSPLLRDINEPAAIIAENVIGSEGKKRGSQ